MISYNEKIYKLFYYWLLISLILVLFIVVVGGLTRLTNSGLSITEWELFKGILPPLNEETWLKYFSLYKEIPQYKLLNSMMTLQEFKIIFFWEYFHRILGRIIGLFFLIPLFYFYITKNIDKSYINSCFIVMFLIIFQGLIGWYMVKSGLVNNVTVSHYRLSIHLCTAFIIASIIFWLLIQVKNKSNFNFFSQNRISYFFYFLFSLLFIQIIMGAFVSGLDAGRIYQTWPLMGSSYFPNDFIFKHFIDLLSFKNHSLVQFYHRNIAYLITFSILILGYFILRNKIDKVVKSYYLLMFFLVAQIILGIITLISGLNIYLASLHQIFSLLLILSTINLYYRFIN